MHFFTQGATTHLVARWVLILALVSGLVPSIGEGVELVVHYASTGHVAHLEPGENDLGDLGAEHGCGPLVHHCGCCFSQPVLPSLATRSSAAPPEGRPALLAYEGKVALGVHARLLRPPIPV